MPDINFSPAVKCPHCGHTNRPAISGWGGQFNTRTKICRKCNREYTLVVYAEGTLEKDVSLEISGIRGRIEYLRSRIYDLKNKLSDKYVQLAEEYIRLEANKPGRLN